eukprot:COSAG02_NODE_46574_length_347_cov_2.201613_2_plen_34_part_01
MTLLRVQCIRATSHERNYDQLSRTTEQSCKQTER